MKVSNNTMIKFGNVRLGDRKFPAAMQLALISNSEAITNALKPYYEVYRGIVEKCAKKDENGEVEVAENGDVTIEDTETLAKELNELSETEVEVPITMIPKHVFERCCDDPAFDTPSVAETAAMSFFIEKE